MKRFQHDPYGFIRHLERQGCYIPANQYAQIYSMISMVNTLGSEEYVDTDRVNGYPTETKTETKTESYEAYEAYEAYDDDKEYERDLAYTIAREPRVARLSSEWQSTYVYLSGRSYGNKYQAFILYLLSIERLHLVTPNDVYSGNFLDNKHIQKYLDQFNNSSFIIF